MLYWSLSILLCTSVTGFMPIRRTPLLVWTKGTNLGWDNEDFLEALGKGDDALRKANEDYDRMKRFKDDEPKTTEEKDPDNQVGADITAEQLAKIKEQNESETNEGGQMFQRMMERAQQGGGERPPPPPENPQSQLPAGFESMSVEAQAALFRELMKSPADLAGPAPAPSNYREKGVAEDGRRVGRNRDADAIVNTSDVYFAQLKRDSSVRNIYRQSGEFDKADAVFEDPEISEIKMHVNPYMEEARQKEKEMIETAPEEMLFPGMQSNDNNVGDVKDSGISYKERLMSRKTGKKGATAVAAPRVEAPRTSSFDPPEPVREQPPPVPEPEPVAPPMAAVEIPSSPQKEEPAVLSSSEQTQKDIRTMMGLLLKHRGGPGFGSGRIKGAEQERFEKLSKSIMEALKSEPVAPEETPVAVPPPVTPVVAATPPPPPAIITPTAPATTTDSVSTAGAITTQPRVPPGERINSMIACIEGAIQMYKNSPPELQDGVLVTLRAALLSAVSTCNELVVNNEAHRMDTFRTVTSDPHTRNPVLDVVPDAPAVAPVTPVEPEPEVRSEKEMMDEILAYTGSDKNTQALEDIYELLQKASGDGKLGLRDDLGADEAEQLADAMSEMRALFVEELETGIPQETPSNSLSYEELLAKAREQAN